jgi:hypothetical protein
VDGPADRAAAGLRAKAFTLGPDIFFRARHYQLEQPAGQRLLAHELTHAVQQSQGYQVGVIQPTYDDLVQNLSKRFSQSVITALQVQPAPTPQMEAEAKRIRDQLPRIVGGTSGKGLGARVRRTGTGTILPKLPRAYIYFMYRGAQKLPSRIRRRRAWMGDLVPALTIRKGRIRLRATEGGLKDLARRQLRAALGCQSNEQAHHIVPLELRDSLTIITEAERNGWEFNGKDNGICISNTIHSGSHPRYTADVVNRLTRLETRLRREHGAVTWATGEKGFRKIVSNLHSDLSHRKHKLK